MVEHVMDADGNGTFKTRCDRCGIYTGEKNYILSMRLDGAITTRHVAEAVMCKSCYGKLRSMIDSWKAGDKKKMEANK